MENEKATSAKVKELIGDCPKSGTAEIRLSNPKRTGSITVRGYKGEDGTIRPFVDQHGQHRVQRIKAKVLINFEKPDDRLLYEQVRLHPIYVKGANPNLSLINHEVEAENYVSLKDMEAQANAIIQTLKTVELKSFARVLLVIVKEGSSDMVIKQKLYEIASIDPTRVINEWNDESKDFKCILHEGLEKNVFTKNNGVYRFRTESIGTSFDLAVEWLRKNDDLIPNIRKEIKELK